MATQDVLQRILSELQAVLGTVNNDEVKKLCQEIRQAERIITVGAGRVGLAVRGFTMRLGHLGFTAHMLGDATVPAVGSNDLLLVASGSGETQTIYDVVAIAKKNGSRIALVTGNPESRMAKLADAIVLLRAPSKVKKVQGLESVQPMTTLNEQCLAILFDAIVLTLMDQLGQTHEDMWARHSNLE